MLSTLNREQDPGSISSTRVHERNSDPPTQAWRRSRGWKPKQVIAVHDKLKMPTDELIPELQQRQHRPQQAEVAPSSPRHPGFLRCASGWVQPPRHQDPADFVAQPLGRRRREGLRGHDRSSRRRRSRR